MSKFQIMANKGIIGIGSNIEPEANVKKALKEINQVFLLTKKSKFIYTEPLLFLEQAYFLNGAVLIETELKSSEIISELKLIEKKLGRIRTENKNSPRTIDLDLIIFNNTILDDDVYERDFLKASIKELMPKFCM